MKTKSSTQKQGSKTRKPFSKKVDTQKKMKENSSEGSLISQEEKNWQTQFILTEHWKSDLDFFTDELKFLQRLMDKYFVWISNDQLMERAKKITTELILIKRSKVNCEKQVTEHLH